MKRDRRHLVKQSLGSLHLTEYLDYRLFLKDLYQESRSRISPYSYLKFSEDLGLSADQTSRLIIVGKRKLMSSTARKIADSLDLTGTSRRYFLTLVDFGNDHDPGKRTANFNKLLTIKESILSNDVDRVALSFFSQWYYPVIWELAGHNDFKFDPAWIQSKIIFPLRIEQIKDAMEILSKLGLIYYDAKKGSYVRNQKSIDTGFEARGIAYVGYHQQMIEMGKRSVTNQLKSEREITCATVCLSSEKISELKGKVRDLVREASAAGDNTGSIVQLNVQLFPFTRM